MLRVNAATCELTVNQQQGRFRFRGEELGERLGARLIGAAVYEMEVGATNWPYHCHHGVEEWMFVVAGAPVLRDQSGQRPLAPGTLVAFASGPSGSHTVAGPGRVVIFSAGAEGWGGAWASVYPDSDKVGVAGMMFRRADALAAWNEAATEPPRAPSPGEACPSVDLGAIDVVAALANPGEGAAEPGRARGRRLAGLLGAHTWAAALWELAPGESTGPYRYERPREQWALVVSGAPTLRHPDGEDVLAPCDLVGFPAGPDGAHRLSNPGSESARLLVISTPVDRPAITVQPEDGTAIVRLSDREGFRFRLRDRVEDYWEGEPGA